MADKPRRIKTMRPARTRRGIKPKPGFAEKPESASKRLRSRISGAKTGVALTTMLPPSLPTSGTLAAPEPTAGPKPRAAATRPRVHRAAERKAALEPAAKAPAEATGRGVGIASALNKELAGFARRLVDDSAVRAGELAAARTLPELLEIQRRQLQALSDAWLEHTARMNQIFLTAFPTKSR